MGEGRSIGGRVRAGRVSGLRPPSPRRRLRRLPRPRALAPRPARLAPARPLRFLSRFAPASPSLQRGAGKMAARGGSAGGAGLGSGPSAGTAGEAAEPALRPGEVAALHPQEVAARLQRMRRELSNRRKILVKNLPQDSSSQVGARAGAGVGSLQPGGVHAGPGAGGKQERRKVCAPSPGPFASKKPFCRQRGKLRLGKAEPLVQGQGNPGRVPPRLAGTLCSLQPTAAVVGEGAWRRAGELRFRGLASGDSLEKEGVPRRVLGTWIATGAGSRESWESSAAGALDQVCMKQLCSAC